MPEFFCPHGRMSMGHSDTRLHPPAAVSCPSCRLVVGQGRATLEDATIATAGTAAGFISSAARRTGAAAVDPRVAIEDMRHAAEAMGADVKRLRMLDYDNAQRLGVVDTTVAEVLATFGSWKGARTAILDAEPQQHGSDNPAAQRAAG